MIIIIFGLPGSGKGTQSGLMVDRYGLKLISVGDVLRATIASNSELGKKVRKIVEFGNLIQDEVICGLLREQLELVDDRFLLDGFPRNLSQARFLTKVLLEKCNRDVDIAIELQIDDKIATDRLKTRLICLDCNALYNSSLLFKKEGDDFACAKCKSTSLQRRIDDSDPFTINRRIREYQIQIEGLRRYYNSKLLKINANLSIDQVRQEIESQISFRFSLT